MNNKTNRYAVPQYPAEIINYAAWLYFRFTLSIRGMEELPAYRRVIVAYEAIHQWTLKSDRSASTRSVGGNPGAGQVASGGGGARHERPALPK